MEWLTMARWSPYAVGTGIGLLVCVALLLSDRPIGCSTAFSRSSGMLERLFRRDKTLEKAYYKEFVPEIDWEWMLVAGVLVGASLAALLSGSFEWRWVPDLWLDAAGGSAPLRWGVALVGGIAMGFGARWAGGCTSGHGISGTLQLALSGWVAAICFFAGGIVTAMLLFKLILA